MYANNLDDAFSAFALGETEEWVKSDKYMDYPEYQDEEYTYIEGRTIGDITAQISVQGESYSQYISFVMDRYYDGIDLTGMSIWIHYELKDGSGSEDSPVNVEYNNNAIRFGWIIPEKATQQSGDIKIGVWVNGTAPNTKPYILKTKEKIYTIHQGLIPGSGITQPDQNWFENFVVQIDSKVSTAQGYANDAQASRTAAAGSAAESAQSAAASAKALEDNRAYVESQKETFVGYNKRETDLKYANALIGTASGMGRVTVGDAWEAPIPDLEIAGRSEQMVTTGAQLLDCSKLNKSAGGAVVNYGDGGYTISGTGTLTASFAASYTLDIKNVLKPGNLILKSQPTMPKLYIRIWDGNTVLAEMQGNSTKQITQEMIDNENVRVECFLYGNTGSTITPGTYHPMLYQSGNGTWEPYTGGKPSPSPEYPQEIVGTDVTSVMVTGAQLMDTSKLARTHNEVTFSIREDGGILVTGNTLQNPANSAVVSTNLPPGTYCVSGSVPAADPKIFVKAKKWYSDGTSVVINDTSFDVDGTETKIDYFVQLSRGLSDINEIVYPMLNAGPTVIPWQPYQSSTATITLTEPLRGIGDVRDRIMCRDGEWGVERWIKETVLNGSVSEVWRLYNTEESAEGLSFFITFSGSAQNFHSSMCDKYSNVSYAWKAEYKSTTGIYSDHNASVSRYFRPPNTDVRTLEQWRAWLSANPLTMVCQITTPTWEPLPSAAQSALNALTTYTGTTHVTITAGGPEPDVGLGYVQDTRAVIAEFKKLIEGMQNVKS